MDEKRGNLFLKISILILAICLIGLGVYTVQFYQESKLNQTILAQEKNDLKSELQQLLKKYEEANIANEALKIDFSREKQKIGRLIDSIDAMEATYVFMRKYKKQVASLKKEKESMFRAIDSLSKLNLSLQNKVDSTLLKLDRAKRNSDSLERQNEKLATQLFQDSTLLIEKLHASGVIFKNNGQIELTTQARKVNKIKVCFKLSKFESHLLENNSFYVQIIDPNNNLLGERTTIKFSDEVLIYSKIIDFPDLNENGEICTLVGNPDQKFVKGRYLVNVFLGPDLLSSERFELE